jgi:hypothetical protein
MRARGGRFYAGEKKSRNILYICVRSFLYLFIVESIVMSVQSRLSDAAKKKDIAALRARAEAFDEKMRQINCDFIKSLQSPIPASERPTMQECVEIVRHIRSTRHD